MSSANIHTATTITTRTEPKVVVVIVNYNTAADTLTCLRSLASIQYSNLEVVVVDNNSKESATHKLATEKLATEESAQLDAAKTSSSVFSWTFIRSPENSGFAAANNIGIRFGRAARASYFWLLNPDTVVNTQTLEQLLVAAAESNLSVYASKILYGSLDSARALSEASGLGGEFKIWSAGGFVNLLTKQVGMYGCGEIDKGQFDTTRECDYAPGCSMFIPAAALDRAGYMPEQFFMYFEETEWCRQMKHAGVSIKYVPTSLVWHRFDDTKLQGPRTVYYYNRNQLAYWFSERGAAEKAWTLFSLVFLKLPGLFRSKLLAPNGESRQVFAAHVQATVDFLLGRMGKRWE